MASDGKRVTAALVRVLYAFDKFSEYLTTPNPTNEIIVACNLDELNAAREDARDLLEEIAARKGDGR